MSMTLSTNKFHNKTSERHWSMDMKCYTVSGAKHNVNGLSQYVNDTKQKQISYIFL